MLDSLIKETDLLYGQQECRDTSVMGCWKLRGTVPAGRVFCAGKGADLVPIPSHAASVVLLQRCGSYVSWLVLGSVSTNPTHSCQAKVLVWF